MCSLKSPYYKYVFERQKGEFSSYMYTYLSRWNDIWKWFSIFSPTDGKGEGFSRRVLLSNPSKSNTSLIASQSSCADPEFLFIYSFIYFFLGGGRRISMFAPPSRSAPAHSRVYCVGIFYKLFLLVGWKYFT